MLGIGHAGQPESLHAPCRSQARHMRLEFPAHPRPVDSIRQNPQIKKPPQGWLFYLVELGGIEPPSANPLQTVLHT